MQENYIAIQDQIGRSIIGVLVNETESTLTINNPVILHLQQDEQGKLIVNTYPIFFFEFIDKANRAKNNWTYSKSNIVVSDVVLDERVVNGYVQLNTPPEPVKVNPKVIKIDDI